MVVWPLNAATNTGVLPFCAEEHSKMTQEEKASKDSSSLPVINTKHGACGVELVTVQCIHAPLKSLCNPRFTFAAVFN